MAIDIKGYTDQELENLRVYILNEVDRRRVISTAQQTAQQQADAYAAAVQTDAPIPAASLPDVLGPGVAITWTDGNTWCNKSGAWLPKTATPDTYPLGWTQETGLPPSVDVWSPTATYKVGDLASYNGATYRCIQPASPNPTWTPDVAVSLWTLA